MTLHHSSEFDNTIEYLPEQEPSHRHFTMVCSISFACFSAAVTETKNYMILDTACRRSCCGTQWIALQAEKLEAARLKIVKQASQEQFQFGAGAPIKSHEKKAWIPGAIEQCRWFLEPMWWTPTFLFLPVCVF